MKRPFIHFYSGDWQSNSNLRRCTHEEKGIWIDILCVLNDQEEHGIVRWTLKEIAHAVGTTVQKINGLIDKGILKGAEAGKTSKAFEFTPMKSGRKKGDPVTLIPEQYGPIWYSSRMVIDEYKRAARSESSSPPNPSPKYAPKGGLGAYLGATPNPPPDYAPHPTPSRADPSLSLSGKPKTPLNPPGGGNPFSKSQPITLKTYLADCKSKGVKPIPEDDTVFDFAVVAGIDDDWLRLAWREFSARYLDSQKRYRDWRRTFRNAVRGNWFKVWYCNDSGEMQLTSQGRTLMQVHGEREAA